MHTNMKWLALLCAAALMLGGCASKQPPGSASGAPQLLELEYKTEGIMLMLTFRLVGMPEGMGVQIDRTEIDPYCQCPGFWRRYFEREPRPGLVDKKLAKNIRLSVTKELVFRIRAVDAAGNLGAWSKPIRAQGVATY
jgi:hypothetical protein